MSYKVICALGDSITSGCWDDEGQGGWFGRLQRLVTTAYPLEFSFVNAAGDGDRTYDALWRLRTEIGTREAHYLIIASGSNDTLRWHKPDGVMDISPDLREELWHCLFEAATKLGLQTLVISPFICNEALFPQKGIFDREYYQNNQDIFSYSDFLKAKATAMRAAYLDCNPELLANLESNFHDAAHFSAKGHQLVAELAFAKLKEIGWLP